MKYVFLSCVFFFFTFGLAAQHAVEDLRIFPNPVADQFEIGNSKRVASIRVINMVGREVRKFEYTSEQPYNISDLPQGMYLVQLRDENDQVIHTQRVKKN
jgi:hypothetical protein